MINYLDLFIAIVGKLILIAAYLSPLFLALILALPFIVIKLRKKKFRAFNIIVSVVIDVFIAFITLFTVVAAQRVEDALLSLLVNILILSFFPFLLLLLTSPFIVIKLRKKRFTILNVIISLFVGVALVVGAVIATYWGFLMLGAAAVYQLYSGYI